MFFSYMTLAAKIKIAAILVIDTTKVALQFLKQVNNTVNKQL